MSLRALRAAAIASALFAAGCGGRETPPTTSPSAAPRVRQVSRALDHACALMADGTIRCWGDDSNGQLGNGLTDETCTHEPLAPECSLRPNVVQGVTNAVQISAGIRQSCALLADGRALCWGAVSAEKDATTPTAIAGLPGDVVEVAVGLHTACVRTGGGEVWCWGSDFLAATPHDDPRRIDGIDHATQIVIGEQHLCVRIDDGHVRCWGFDTACQLLQPPGSFPPDGVARAPTEVPGIADAVEIAADEEATAVLHADGTLTLSGCDPLPGTVMASLRPAVHVSAGGDQVCTIDRLGAPQCFENWPLGDGTRDGHFDRFVDVVGLAPVQQISTASGSCVVTNDGVAWCWGVNDLGQVGDGTSKERDVPTRVVW